MGSRAREKNLDPLSDYDLSLFCKEMPEYIREDDWLSEIGKVWVCVHEKIYFGNKEFPTRLVIFESGVKVDFTFFSIDALDELINSFSLPPEYDMGYKILLDKDSVAGKIPVSNFKALYGKKPTNQEFINTVKEFWFEAYHVAIYLKRGDLWSAKVRSSGIQNTFLLKMIEWNEVSRNGLNYTIPHAGKAMQSWVSKSTFDALGGVFAHFDTQDSWKSLLHTIDLFRNLALETAQQCGLQYPHEVDQNLSIFILKLRDQEE